MWDKNKAALDTAFPGLADKITAARSEPPIDVRVELSASGNLTMVVNGAYAHSKRDPSREGERLAEALLAGGSLSEGGVIVALGFGLGWALLSAARKSGNSRPIVIVEKRPELLKTAFESADFTEFLSGNTMAFVLGGMAGNNEDAVLDALARVGKRYARKVALILKNPAVTALDADWYAGVEQRIRSWAAKDTVNEATLKRFGGRWTRNALKNIKQTDCIYRFPGVLRLQGLLKGNMPVLLVAAGPSLDDTAMFMGEFARRCAVVCVDTALDFFTRAAGSAPDWVVSSDPQYWNSRHLDRLGAEDSCLVTECAIYPSTLRRSQRTFLFATHAEPARAAEEASDPKGVLGSGGSVATTAFDFCLLLDPSAIFIAGLDLSFPQYKTHFKDAFFEKSANARSSRLRPAETASFLALRSGGAFYAKSANGGLTLTDKRLSLYAAWFENRLATLKSDASRRPPPIRSLSPRGLAINSLAVEAPAALLRLPERRDEIRCLLQDNFERIDREFAHEEPQRRVRFLKWFKDF